MRDLAVLAMVFAAAPVALVSPYFGILMWYWIAYFNPHRYTWGVAYDFPVAMVIAIPTLVGLIFIRQLNRRIFSRDTMLLIALWAWFGITTYYISQVPDFAGHVADAQAKLLQISKILLLTFATMLVVTNAKRLRYLTMVAALSFGGRAIPGALFAIRTGGQSRIFGPPDSFVGDNNEFALALNMSLGMLFYLAKTESNPWLRRFLWFAFSCSLLCVILSYSRGGLLGLAAVLLMIVAKSRRKMVGACAVAVCALAVLAYAPDAWMARMQNFLQGRLDDSARERLITWQTGINLVKDYPLTGGGFEVFPDEAVFQLYQPEPLPNGGASLGPHSIYFQMLGEQGIIGLSLFLVLLTSCLLTLRKLRRLAKLTPTAEWIIPFTNMFELGIIVFMLNGATLGRAYFDYFYFFVACTTIIRALYRQQLFQNSERELHDTESHLEEAVAY